MGCRTARFGWPRWLLAVANAGLVACALAAREPAADAPASHAVESARLAERMRGLDFLSRERLPQAMDLEQERTRRLYKIARVAAAIAESAAQLEVAAGETALSAEERRAFAAHAEELRRRARALANNAHRLGPAALRAAEAGIQETCAGCHQRFRATEGAAPRPRPF